MTARHRTAGRVGFQAVLRVRVFAVLFAAETQSIVGDQLARVALSVLVFAETGSAPATAATYAATLLPAVVGGLLLGRLGDRFPRRAVMIGCDLLRALCFALMSLPALPLGVVIGLLVFAVFFGPVFTAAEVSYLSTQLGAEQFRAANGLRMIAVQAAQVGGFVFGGILVAAVSPRAALLVDAVTFALSAAAVAGLARAGRPEPNGPAAEVQDDPAPAEPTFAGLWRTPRVRGLVLLALLAGFFVVPEGLAVPFGASVSASTWQVGALLAAGAAGAVVGAVVVVRLTRPGVRARTAGIMAVVCGLLLAPTAVTDTWPAAALFWFLSGVFGAYMVEASTMIVAAIPDARRAHLLGVVGALLLGAQGGVLVLFGVLADVVQPGTAIALAGLVGSAAAVLLLVGPLWHPDDADIASVGAARAADGRSTPRPVAARDRAGTGRLHRSS